MGLPRDDYVDFFRRNESLYGRLKKEVEFILRDMMENCGIKVHSISGRVKDLDHALEKIERKGYSNPQGQIEDIVGCRIVCLFLSDLDKVGSAIRREFKIITAEDKVEGGAESSSAFGYMSVHYICELSRKHSGARYDSLKKIKFELQVRTILMDAWANVSHYLAYKGDASIPEHLRRDFYALSGLFYVADKHFELFIQEAIAGEQQAISQAATGQLDDEPINLETVQALLGQMYPERKHSGSSTVSEFVEELIARDYTTIAALRNTLVRTDENARRAEIGEAKENHFTDVGFARLSLILADANFRPEGQFNSIWEKYILSESG